VTRHVFAGQLSALRRKSTMTIRRSVVLAGALALAGLASPAFAQGRDVYPEGSIFWQMHPGAKVRPNQAAPRPDDAVEPRKISPLNPLDQPGAEGAWKPSNRDAGNLAAERWSAYALRRQQLSQGAH
jgi:hypothetical protein